VPPPPQLLQAQDQEIQQLITRFQASQPNAVDVQQLEVLARTAIFKPANQLVGYLLQAAADRIDAAYQPAPGQHRKDRQSITVQGIFGSFELERDYYYHEGKKLGHIPVDAALGLEVGHTPALARLVCLEGADETSYRKAENHLRETGGIPFEARQIQRLVQHVGADAQLWQEREFQPAEAEPCDAPVMYVSADGAGAPMRKSELVGRAGKQADGNAKTRQVYLGCVFTQHGRDEKGHPIRDWESATYVSSLDSIDQFGPMLRREALRRGMGQAGKVVVPIDGANGLENMGKVCFRDEIQIVDFYHAMDHAGDVLQTLLGNKGHPEYKSRHRRWAKLLLKDGVEKLIAQTRLTRGNIGPLQFIRDHIVQEFHQLTIEF